MTDISFNQDKIEFIGYGEPGSLAKQEIQGEKLWNLVFQRDNNFGGFFAGLFGIMGSGKTTLMHKMAKRFMKENPDEIIFWRESVNSPCQFTKLGKNKYQVLCETSYPIKVLDINNDLKPAPVKVRYFRGVQELVKMAKPGLLNVVYFDPLIKWIKLLELLGKLPDWYTVFMDEFEDVAPSGSNNSAPEKKWQKLRDFSDRIKHIRKSRVNLFTNSQGADDVDNRIRSKITMWIFLYGSKHMKASPVRRESLQALTIGKAWVDHGHGLYGKFGYSAYPPTDLLYTIEPKNSS